MPHLRLVLLGSLVAAIVGATEPTDEDRALAQKSFLTVQAFECSVLARGANDPVAAERLFRLGYEEGLAWLRAAEAGELHEELQNDAPLYLLMLLGGPSHDFRLGRIFGYATDQVYENVYDGQPSDEISAKHEYHRRNCDLLGPSGGGAT